MMSSKHTLHIIAAAIVISLLNAVKPIQIDDLVYFYYARQITQHPLAPYDFEIPWNQIPDNAQNPIGPPVVPYWLAAGMQLFGPSVFLWRFWFLPINLLLATSLVFLFRRFARGLEIPLLWMTVLSPVILPSINLMLDVPCLALGLTSLALFATACDRRSIGLAIVAGVTCGLAIETKWTAFLSLATIMAYSVLYVRPKQGIAAVLTAVAVFVAWESYIALQNGESHFLHQLKLNSTVVKENMAFSMFMLLGAVAPAVTLLGLAALRARRWVFLSVGGSFALGFALMVGLHPVLQSLGPIRTPITGKPWVPKLGTPLFIASGLAFVVTMGLVVWRLWASRLRHLLRPSRRDDLFLIAWLGIEFAGYFVFSPFPAVRRVIAFVVVSTIVAGRLASRNRRSRESSRLVSMAMAFSMTLGAIYYSADLADAIAGKRAAEESATWIRERDPNAKIYFTGGGGFEFYAPRVGLEPMVSDRTEMKAGDWLVIEMTKPDSYLCYELSEKDVKLETILNFSDSFPLTTLHYFYIGARPIETRMGPRARSLIYRVAADLKPARTFKKGRLVIETPIPWLPKSWIDVPTAPAPNP
jgi:hypothetical protein